jgi:hypothetical protein
VIRWLAWLVLPLTASCLGLWLGTGVAGGQAASCTFTHLEPETGSTVADAQPLIAASFECVADVVGHRVTLDGQPVDVELGGPDARRGSLFFQPATALRPGRHMVRVELRLAGGGLGAVENTFSVQAGGAGCRFVLGFATLHDLIPGIVGACLENEHHNPANGDALQATTNGLLVWRKADNFTAFTDGFRTWVNGPYGLQQRLNRQRLAWEWNPDGLPVTPPPRAGDRCHTAGLSLVPLGGEAGAGHAGRTMQLRNTQGVPCTLYGYVGAQRLGEANDPLPTQVVRGGGYISRDPGPRLVRLAAGGTATFGLEWGQVPVGEETTCPTSTQLAVIPPDEYAPIVIPMEFTACGGGRLHVTAILPPG